MRFHRNARDDLAIKGQCCTVSLWSLFRKVAVVVAAAEAEAVPLWRERRAGHDDKVDFRGRDDGLLLLADRQDAELARP